MVGTVTGYSSIQIGLHWAVVVLVGRVSGTIAVRSLQ